MKFKGVDLTPLMGIGGWAIDVIEKAIPDQIGIVYMENHKAWFLWDFYPTLFLGTGPINYWVIFEDRIPGELVDEVIIKPWLEARFERFIYSLFLWFKSIDLGALAPTQETIEAIAEQWNELKGKEIRIPILWIDKNFAGTFIWQETKEGSKPVGIDKLTEWFMLGLKSPEEIPEEAIPKGWRALVEVLGDKGYEGYLVGYLGFFAEGYDNLEALTTIREGYLEAFKEGFEANPHIVKGIEFLLMGTKWYEKFMKLKEELKGVRV